MIGAVYISVAKARAEALARDSRLAPCFANLAAIERDLATPGLPRHIVEGALEMQEQLINTIMEFKR